MLSLLLNEVRQVAHMGFLAPPAIRGELNLLTHKHYRHFVWGLVGSVLVVGAMAIKPARGADPAFVGLVALAVDEEVAKKLELSDEVKAQLAALVEQRENAALELVQEIKGLSDEEKAAKIAPFVAESEKEGLKLLT